MKILVLGLGNILLRDEGLGVQVVNHLHAGYVFPQDVTVLDGGTLGLELLQYLEAAERVVLVDAVGAEQPPGSLVRLAGDEIPAFLGAKISPHQVGLADMLALARLRGRFPEEVILWGAQAERLEPGLELSPAVAAQVEPLAERVLAELSQWGVEVRRK